MKETQIELCSVKQKIQKQMVMREIEA